MFGSAPAKRPKKLAADIADMHSIGKGSGLGYAISKPQGKGLPYYCKHLPVIGAGTLFCSLLSCICLVKVLLGVKMRVLRAKKRASCGGISSIPISC